MALNFVLRILKIEVDVSEKLNMWVIEIGLVSVLKTIRPKKMRKVLALLIVSEIS